MTLRPTHIALDKTGGMFVVIDDYPETTEALLIPCSFAHRRVVSRAEYQAMELHAARYCGIQPDPPPPGAEQRPECDGSGIIWQKVATTCDGCPACQPDPPPPGAEERLTRDELAVLLCSLDGNYNEAVAVSRRIGGKNWSALYKSGCAKLRADLAAKPPGAAQEESE